MLLALLALLAGGPLPATCTLGETYILDPAGPQVYYCYSSNSWRPSAIPPTGFGDNSKFLRADLTWTAPTAAAAWGSITGTLSSQSDLQTALNAKSTAPTTVVLSANRTNATTSYADLTDLVVPLLANTRYKVSCVFQYDANAITTGLGVGWTGPASPTFTTGVFQAPITTATAGTTVSVGNDTGAVTSASAATTNNNATFDGVWHNGANAGNLQMRFKSEVAVASAIIVKAGSMCQASVY